MSKLQLSETARVLHTTLGHPTFTVDELAMLCSAKDTTVRTILFRSKHLIEQVTNPAPNLPGRAAPGRPSKRYRLSESGREQLARELAELTAELREHPELADTSGRIEAALEAGESSLQLARDPQESATVNWHARARVQTNAARKLLVGIYDVKVQERYARRISAIDAELTSASKSTLFRWLERTRDQLAPMLDSSRASASPASAMRLSETASTAGFADHSSLPCLWLDATDSVSPSWNAAVAKELRDAQHAPLHLRIELVAADPTMHARLEDAMAELPTELPVFVTMCSREAKGRELAKWLLHGPLQPAIRVGEIAGRAAPSITVLDHDLPEDPFWLNHGITNLRYYPTVQPSLARRLAERNVESLAAGRIEPITIARSGTHGGGVPSELAPKLLRGDHLTPGAAELAFAALEVVSRRLNPTQNRPTCLIGLNRGGYLLARMLWSRGRLRADYLVKCEYHPPGGRIVFDDLPNDEVSSFLIVDDVVRTGRTLSAVRAYLAKRYPGRRVHALALAAVAPNNAGGSIPPHVDYCAWISHEPDLSFPWSNIRELQPSPAEYLNTTGVNQVGEWLPDLA